MHPRYECVARKGLGNGTVCFNEGLTHPCYECVAPRGAGACRVPLPGVTLRYTPSYGISPLPGFKQVLPIWL